MDRPKVSVIIPCYNLGRFLDEAVDSVFAQTLQDFEILIVNDGSTDPFTVDLLADYRRPNTRVFTTENRGVGSARNLGIENAAGGYVCALDADDRLHPSYLEKSVAVLDGDRSITFVSCWVRMFEGEDWLWKQDRCDLPALLAECTVCTAALVRREAVLAVGGHCRNRECSEDWDLWISLVEHGFRGVILPEELFYYRRRPGSKSALWEHVDASMRRMAHLFEKHEASYRKYLFDVLLWKKSEIAEVLRGNFDLELHIETSLKPELRSRKKELERIRLKLRGTEGDAVNRPQLENALIRARQEMDVLVQSKSWRLTAPLRAAARASKRLMGRLTSSGDVAGTDA